MADDKVDVVVIGGGVVGVSAAIELAATGHKVVLAEKGRVAAEQSTRNWGWIRKLNRDPRELPLMIESSRIWAERALKLDTDVGLVRNGTTYLASTEAELERQQAWLDAAEPFQTGAFMMSRAEVAEHLGRDDVPFAGAIRMPSDMGAEPRVAVPTMARMAREAGVDIREDCAVRSVETEGGRLSAVVTEAGPIRCDAAILAGGAWCRTFLANMDVHVPHLAIRASVFRTAPAPSILSGNVGAAGASLRRRGDGGYSIGRSNAATFDLIPAGFRHLASFAPLLRERWRIVRLRAGRSFFGPLGAGRWSATDESPFERCRVLDPAPDAGLLADVRREAERIHPGLGTLDTRESWAGMIDVTPDEIPMIDAVPGTAGLWVAAGLSGHGFGLGPGVGRLVADMASGRAPLVDPAAFALSRFRGFETDATAE